MKKDDMIDFIIKLRQSLGLPHVPKTTLKTLSKGRLYKHMQELVMISPRLLSNR